MLTSYNKALKLSEAKGDIATFKATIDSIAKYIAQIPDKTQEIDSKPTKEDIVEIQGYIDRLKAYEN